MTARDEAAYILGRSGAELRRLQAQVALLRRITGVFSETLEYGLRVLDLASHLPQWNVGKNPFESIFQPKP
jgi:hypothetical protein